jgi:hypothetical protein
MKRVAVRCAGERASETANRGVTRGRRASFRCPPVASSFCFHRLKTGYLMGVLPGQIDSLVPSEIGSLSCGVFATQCVVLRGPPLTSSTARTCLVSTKKILGIDSLTHVFRSYRILRDPIMYDN